MKKKFWHFYLVFLWKIQHKITHYVIDKWFGKGLFDDFGTLSSSHPFDVDGSHK